MKTAEQEVSDFNRRFRVGDNVDVLWDREAGRTSRHLLVTPAYVWQSGEAVAQVGQTDCSIAILCAAIHMPAGVGG